MSTVYKIPTQPQAQSFEITLGANTYDVTLKWNAFANCWVMDFSDENDNPILQGVPLITGADLLEQYGYLDFGGQLISQMDAEPAVPPTYQGLGTDGNLYFVVP